jgi:hypothetical protein
MADCPYILEEEVIVHRKYNPEYGDERICICGHSYYRHFDSYEAMYPIGCKYCWCRHFIERTNQKLLSCPTCKYTISPELLDEMYKYSQYCHCGENHLSEFEKVRK